MSEADPVVMVRGVVKRFGEFVAVNRVSFTLRKGEIVALLGPNGAGKTTLIRTLVGLLPREEGEILVLGEDPQQRPQAVRRFVGYMPQILSLYQELQVRELLEIFADFHGLPPHRIRSRLNELREQYQLEIWWERRVGDLPRGIQQRVGLSLALLADPPILLLDEPTSGVAPQMRRVFWNTLRVFRDAGKTLLVTTHDLREAEQADRILTLYRGRVVADGTLPALREQSSCRVVRFEESAWKVMEKDPPPGVVLPRGRWLDVVVTSRDHDALQKWMRAWELQGTWISPDLEHLFISWIRP